MEKRKAGEETERHHQEQQKKLNGKIEKISSFLEAMEKKGASANEGGHFPRILDMALDNMKGLTLKFLKGQSRLGRGKSDMKQQISNAMKKGIIWNLELS
jgi:hypothetical protein